MPFKRLQWPIYTKILGLGSLCSVFLLIAKVALTSCEVGFKGKRWFWSGVNSKRGGEGKRKSNSIFFGGKIGLWGTDNDNYLIVDACPNAMEIWKAIKRLKQGESINVQDLETNLCWEFGNFTSQEDDEPEEQESKAHYMFMEKIQELTPDAADNFGPIFDDKPLQKVHNSDDDYNVFANERHHLEQPESVNDTYLMEQGDTYITHDSSYMSNNGEEADQDDQML
uniref:Uncharacterized protein n=1 Tax=Tanacetum cinerariifolium TaxID=118510 RepID=A0A6L2KEC8_TANCI|nr:hypothetical protein [Tanacetum cinerariifolium]